MLVVGSTEAHRHIDPNIYSNWEGLLVDDRQILPLASEWFELNSHTVNGFNRLFQHKLAEVCENQQAKQTKLMKVVEEAETLLDREGKWIDACNPQAVLSVSPRATEQLLARKDFKKVRSQGKETFFVKEKD